MENNKNLKIIKGGLKSFLEADKVFVSAYATKSRLMGSIWLCATWDVLDSYECKSLIQYFYIDCDQYGIEDFHHIYDPSKIKIKLMENTTVNCMGSDRVDLDLKQLKYIIKKYHNFTLSSGEKLHKDWKLYQFILNDDIKSDFSLDDDSTLTNVEDNVWDRSMLSKGLSIKGNIVNINKYKKFASKMKSLKFDKGFLENTLLNESSKSQKSIEKYIPLSERILENETIESKEPNKPKSILKRVSYIDSTENCLSTKPDNNYGILNYFLMRFFAYDLEIAKYFLSEDFDFKRFLENNEIEKGYHLLLNNKINEIKIEADVKTYFNKSIIQDRENSYLVTSTLSIKNKKIVDFKILDKMSLSAKEIVLMLKKPEYILLYQLDMEYLPLSNLPLYTKIPISESSYENGYMYMAFKKDNNHVLEDTFNMSNDIYGTYILTLTNQIAICAPSIAYINKLKDNLMSMPISKYLKEISTAYFDISSSLEFINSEYLDFTEFLDSFTDNEEDDL